MCQTRPALRPFLGLLLSLGAGCASTASVPRRPAGISVFGRVGAHTTEPERISFYRVDTRGATELVPGARTTSDSEGHFLANLQLPDGAVLMVHSEGSAGAHTALVHTSDITERRLAVPVLSSETTIEAEVYLTALRTGLWRDSTRVHRLRSFITPALAETVLRAADYAAALALVARASDAAVGAWDSMLAALGAEPQTLADIDVDLNVAQSAADAKWIDANTILDESLAVQSLRLTQEGIYNAAGLDDFALAAASVAAADSLRNVVAGDPSAVAHMLRLTVDALRAKYIGAWLLGAPGDPSAGASPLQRPATHTVTP